ncbi:sensor histidine kinase [Nonomuraea typhae]|uniref:histidine kinase n=1 Tax=Nonomuraea typhae TaxID=2603600 RepID=A0ABW7ZAP5_9ACTN
MRRTVRLRLTLLYSGLFLVAGALLVGLIYVLVELSPFPSAPAAPSVPGGGLTVPEPVVPAGRDAAGLRRLLVNSLIALPVMALASMWLGWVMAGRVLRPLGAMTATVRRITADRLDRRLAAGGPDDELKELSDTFDQLLDRLEAAFTAQRRFVANASHELRTPLTLQRTMAEVALSDPDADAGALRAVLERLLAAGLHQERLIEALLTLARGYQGLAQSDPLDLAVVAEHCLPPTGLRVTAELEHAWVRGDRDLLERLVTNVLDNAVKHNRPDGWITVWTGLRQGRPALRIQNSGPVIPPDRVPALLQPFQRLAPGRRALSDGLGLGLSIVAAVAEAHRGDLDVAALPEGGLSVTVTFP